MWTDTIGKRCPASLSTNWNVQCIRAQRYHLHFPKHFHLPSKEREHQKHVLWVDEVKSWDGSSNVLLPIPLQRNLHCSCLSIRLYRLQLDHLHLRMLLVCWSFLQLWSWVFRCHICFFCSPIWTLLKQIRVNNLITTIILHKTQCIRGQTLNQKKTNSTFPFFWNVEC